MRVVTCLKHAQNRADLADSSDKVLQMAVQMGKATDCDFSKSYTYALGSVESI